MEDADDPSPESDEEQPKVQSIPQKPKRP
jgi:hypothetical protein